MNYFENFPVTKYDFGGKPITLVHLLRRFSIKKLVIDNVRVYTEYHIADGETPDGLAYRWYDDPYKFWIILLFNNIIDPFYGWPLTNDNLVEYCKYKYGDSNVYATHHYESPLGHVVTPALYDGTVTSISNYEYETRLNDAKRKIRIPQREHAENIAREAEQILLDS